MSIVEENIFYMSDEDYGDEQEVQKNLDCTKIIKAPEIRMYFDSLDNFSLFIFIFLL